MFWGLVIESVNKYSRTVEDGFVVTMAALGPSSEAGDRVHVYLTVNGSENLLCTLESGKTDQQQLEISASVGEDISFFTRSATKPTAPKVYLSGFLTRNSLDPLKAAAQKVLDGKEDDGSAVVEAESDEDEDEEEEEESDDEVEEESKGKRTPAPADDGPAKKRAKQEKPAEKAPAPKAAAKAPAPKAAEKPKEAPAKAKPATPVGRKQNGVDVIDFKEGTGAAAKKGDKVTLKYKGFLKTKKGDKVFDQGNFDFVLGKDGVIEGWHRGIQGMKLKGQRRLVIPPKLGYGRQGAPPDIPPNATLHFDLLLKNIKPGKAPYRGGR